MPAPSRSLRTVLGGLLLTAGLLATPTLTSPAQADPSRPGQGASDRPGIEPVLDANFADPDILLVDGVYHAYATNNEGINVQHQTSTDLRSWTPQADAAPVLGDWVGDCSFTPGGLTDRCIWAPEVTAVDGGYALYYTARDATSQRQCIGVSLSPTPAGPFVPVGTEPLVCPSGARGTVDMGGAIDASTYVEDGQRYLLWKADGNCCPGMTAIIYLQPLSGDGATLTGPPVEILRRDQPFEGNVVEAPTLVKHDGTYYLFYSANDFFGAGYRTGYATSRTLLGPYVKSPTELMTTDMFQGDVRGPGGQDVVVRPDGSTAIVFHGWDPTYTYRAMYLSPLTWSPTGVPSVAEAADRYQAEDGRLSRARVVPDDSASARAKVGGMDFADSSVTIDVHAERSGPWTLGIRYANGSTEGSQRVAATDLVSVNGAPAGTVTFAHTTWGNWQLVEHDVRLKKGWNTITLTRGTYFAEIDSIDVYEHTPSPAPKGPPADPTKAVRYEAEAGQVVRARVRQEPTASAGAVVGGLDFSDSSVTLTVEAAKAGPATLGIVFSNGSDRGGYPEQATDTVTVNGRSAGTVVFPHTRWGNWQTVEHRVVLKKGTNTVTLTRSTFFTELDAVDVY